MQFRFGMEFDFIAETHQIQDTQIQIKFSVFA